METLGAILAVAMDVFLEEDVLRPNGLNGTHWKSYHTTGDYRNCPVCIIGYMLRNKK